MSGDPACQGSAWKASRAQRRWYRAACVCISPLARVLRVGSTSTCNGRWARPSNYCRLALLRPRLLRVGGFGQESVAGQCLRSAARCLRLARRRGAIFPSSTAARRRSRARAGGGNWRSDSGPGRGELAEAARELGLVDGDEAEAAHPGRVDQVAAVSELVAGDGRGRMAAAPDHGPARVYPSTTLFGVEPRTISRGLCTGPSGAPVRSADPMGRLLARSAGWMMPKGASRPLSSSFRRTPCSR